MAEKNGQPVERLLLTVDEVAEALGVCRSAVYDLMRLRRLPSLKIGRARRVAVDDLREFVRRESDASGGVAA